MWQRMHLAFDLSFLHTEGRWRYPGAWAGYGYYPNPDAYEDVARLAERGRMDMLFFGDGTGIPDTWEGSLDGAVKWGIQWPRHDKSPLTAMMARVTKHVGFAVTFSPTYMHPYYVARLMTSLDHLTGGRIALNLITSTRLSDAGNYGYDELPPHDARYDRMEEFVSVCQQLWDSVEPDAIILDHESGVFADPAKVHAINHDGEYFKVRGPLNCMPSPQGHPVLLQAGASPRGIKTSAKFADMVFAPGSTAATIAKHRKALDEGLVEAGRSTDDAGVLWAVRVVVGESKEDARRRQMALLDSLPLEAGGVYLSHNSGFDYSTLPEKFTLEQVKEQIEAQAGSQSSLVHSLVAEYGETKVMSKDDLLEYGKQSMVGLDRAIVGTPAQIADRLEELHAAGGSKGGFMIASADVLPGSFNDFVDLVIPELQHRGVFRKEYESSNLREQLFE